MKLGKNTLRVLSSILAAAGTLWAMTLPGFTLEYCGQEEHQHGDICFETVEVLHCGVRAHSHGESCFDADGSILCGQADALLHSHGQNCYDRTGVLWCELPEILIHTHEESCYWRFTKEETGQVQSVRICGEEERQLHVHAEACFQEESLICGRLQLEEHGHDASCFATETVLSCRKEEHIHGEDCSPQEETIPEPVVLTVTETAAKAAAASVGAMDGDIATVSESGIDFQLFNYSDNINKNADGDGWRDLADYFTFRDSNKKTGTQPSNEILIPEPGINEAHDADGFTAKHATVERVLQNGMPILDLTRNADGTARTDPGVSSDIRNLGYLFGGTGDNWVKSYHPSNTILQKNGNHYWYTSQSNAVDYDAQANLFRLRSYPERNSTTATYGEAYGDFLPFNATGGVALNSENTDAVPYHLASEDADYWFGMTMEVSFYQSKDGLLGDENMVFRFSGDDEVWVFVDNVLVLDLGGTHGTVDGSIDFATGEILQYLSWRGANATEEAQKNRSATSFPTTLRACFDAAGRQPNGGWSADGTTFADYTEHTLKFFYLERGAAVANCKIDFCLPTLPDKSLTVTKELTTQEDAGVTDFIRDSLTYRFRVMQADAQGEATEDYFLKPGTLYALLEGGVQIGSGTVEADGTFSLKAGQSAQFTEMLEKGGGCTNYVVQEILPDSLTGQYAGVEYVVSGQGGQTKTEEGPTEDFTAFETEVLSAEQTQLVTFRNKVESSKLCRLEITKEQADGSGFTGEESFPVQVKLGGQLLPAGTEYRIGEDTFAVSEAGILPLKIGQTAVLVQGILSGTAYEVTELDSQGLYYRPSYSGTISPEGTVSCAANGASGEFTLGSLVAITVTNASFDFAVQIPISKEAFHNEGKASFDFAVQQVFPESDGTWTAGEESGVTTIAVVDDAVTEASISLGFRAGTEGTFYYQVSETPGTANYLYDETFYILEITAHGDAAQITGLWKNGTEQISPEKTLAFVNHRITDLRITKQVIGANAGEEFSFTAAVTWSGNTTQTPFALSHEGEFLLEDIPWGAEVVITEEKQEHYRAFFQLAGSEEDPTEGNTATICVDREGMILQFINESAYELPQTGGRGTNLYTLGGLLQMAAAGILLYIHRKRDRASA